MTRERERERESSSSFSSCYGLIGVITISREKNLDDHQLHLTLFRSPVSIISLALSSLSSLSSPSLQALRQYLANERAALLRKWRHYLNISLVWRTSRSGSISRNWRGRWLVGGAWRQLCFSIKGALWLAASDVTVQRPLNAITTVLCKFLAGCFQDYRAMLQLFSGVNRGSFGQGGRRE